MIMAAKQLQSMHHTPKPGVCSIDPGFASEVPQDTGSGHRPVFFSEIRLPR